MLGKCTELDDFECSLSPDIWESFNHLVSGFGFAVSGFFVGHIRLFSELAGPLLLVVFGYSSKVFPELIEGSGTMSDYEVLSARLLVMMRFIAKTEMQIWCQYEVAIICSEWIEHLPCMTKHRLCLSPVFSRSISGYNC
jgi:hypothetical protein